MSSQIETIVNAYKILSKIPSIASGTLNTRGNHITAKWSVRNLDKCKNTKYLYNYSLNDQLDVVAESDFGIDVSNEIISAVSPKGKFKAIIREEKNEKNDKKQLFEVWESNRLRHSVDLTALDLHGDVYSVSEFSSFDWTQDETTVLYVAEKKIKKSEPYIKRKAVEADNGREESVAKKGEEYLYRQDWGEQLVGKYYSVIVVARVEDESFTVLEGLPETWCPGQVCFAPDGLGVVGVAWETAPRRLGLRFCTNRPGYLFHLTLDGHMTNLSEEGASVCSPRLNPAGELVWLQRAAGGPHHACHALYRKRNFLDDAKETVIDIVQKEVSTADGGVFHGVYCQTLPERCFSVDGTRVVFSTPQKLENRAYVVDIDGGRLVDISHKGFVGSTTVLDVSNDVILASCSNLTTPGRLFVAKLPAKGGEGDVVWKAVSEPAEVPAAVAGSSVQHLTFEHQDSQDDVKTFSALYLAPRGEKLPLVVWPHGGPHSGFVDAYSIEAAFYSMLGFASLLINYRGSTGAGQASIQFLLNRIGDADVKDCKLATDKVKAFPAIDDNNICLSGGSHGGFLVAHLCGQYPEVYRAVVARNPVIDLASMFNSTDIADWVNYRGSIGHGDANVRSIIGRIGEYDVQDCIHLLSAMKDRNVDMENCFLYGGSYGGFVAAHLAGRYPIFKAMVLRNPLIDLATKGNYGDNSDGCAVETGYEFSERGPVSEEQLLRMRRASPLVHAHRVRAPLALLLGSKDLRVPHHQGMEYARRLAANGVETRVYMYEDNHSLSSFTGEMDSMINGAAWMLQHLEPSL